MLDTSNMVIGSRALRLFTPIRSDWRVDYCHTFHQLASFAESDSLLLDSVQVSVDDGSVDLDSLTSLV